MADEEEKDEDEGTEEEEKPAGKKFPIVIVAVLIVVALILAGGISYFITSHVVASHSEDNVSVPVNHDPGVFVKLGDAKEGIIVNVGGIKSSRFLKVGIVLELNPEREDILAEGKVNQMAETKIMDTVLTILRTIKIEELDANKQSDLKNKMKEDLNKAMGAGTVYDVYITSFMLQ